MTTDTNTPDATYAALQARLCQGWNTWDVRSLLSHVLLPHALAVRIGIKEYASGRYLGEALVGRHGEQVEAVRPGVRSYDGAYTELEITWANVRLRVESTADDSGLLLLVTPLDRQSVDRSLRLPVLVVGGAFLWNSDGVVRHDGLDLLATPPGESAVRIACSGQRSDDRNVPATGPYVAVTIEDQPIVITAGKPYDAPAARKLLDARRESLHASFAAQGERDGEIAGAVQSALAWNTIHDPDGRRAISPVSRVWSSQQGGWVLFCWDTYFAAILASATGNVDLAYANVVEITRHATEAGFVPNTTNAHGFATRDRSQPPVGGTVLLELFRRHGDAWVVRLLLDRLLKWNRWWHEARAAGEGCLAWGSNTYAPVVGNEWETAKNGVGGRFGGALESGMDNSPTYDDVPFDAATGTLALQDVGLTSLYVSDCDALAELATAVDRHEVAAELRGRAQVYRAGLASLWCEELGLFANRRLDTGEFSHRSAPPSFFPLLVPGVATASQMQRMLKEHLHAPTRFGGEWVIPSCPRDDAAYPEQHYWRGRIWGPHNYLVWLGLRRSGLDDAAADLAHRSAALLLREWRSHRHVHENYHGDSGDGCGYRWSDSFYHWGGLLGIPSILTPK
ncbi:MAG TPA: trehalase family glycosidase [Tepidisphaeraceae bacterium]|jgi:hypothetical protein|nr:trehalase family glycosidase [Tepidisphaeraceae bacterium]